MNPGGAKSLGPLRPSEWASRENLTAADIRLTEDELKQLDEVTSLPPEGSPSKICLKLVEVPELWKLSTPEHRGAPVCEPEPLFLLNSYRPIMSHVRIAFVSADRRILS